MITARSGRPASARSTCGPSAAEVAPTTAWQRTSTLRRMRSATPAASSAPVVSRARSTPNPAADESPMTASRMSGVPGVSNSTP